MPNESDESACDDGVLHLFWALSRDEILALAALTPEEAAALGERKPADV